MLGGVRVVLEGEGGAGRGGVVVGGWVGIGGRGGVLGGRVQDEGYGFVEYVFHFGVCLVLLWTSCCIVCRERRGHRVSSSRVLLFFLSDSDKLFEKHTLTV
mmetsp:Transcript_63801/g.75511  ORF Transcript_63801/g.75511 Transcript_63801/m.75511 type:complete len:101 (-) Transcript_63801:114-416(-)